MIMFDEDGELCLRQQSLKMVLNHHVTVEGQKTEEGSVWFSVPLSPNTPTPSMTELENQDVKQLLPQNSHNEITGNFGRMLVDVTVDDIVVSKDGAELKVEKTI